MQRRRDRHGHGDAIGHDAGQAKRFMQPEDQHFVEPAVGDPRFIETVAREGIIARHAAMFDDPLADAQVPPDVRIDDRIAHRPQRHHEGDGVHGDDHEQTQSRPGRLLVGVSLFTECEGRIGERGRGDHHDGQAG